MTNFEFTTRETYLAYRANWKANYKAQSQKIRDLRRELRAADQDEQPRLQSRLHYARVEANRMNLELAAAKQEAAAQRAARLPAAA